jgi:hypothetical protein
VKTGCRVAAFCLSFAAGLLLVATSGYAQLATGMDAQLLQQGQAGSTIPGSGAQPSAPSDVTILPPSRASQPQLPQSRLEQIMSARAGAKLQQFGYDALGQGRAVTIPQAGAVQDNYILGPGDEIVLSLRGQENSEFRATVSGGGAQFWRFSQRCRSLGEPCLCRDHALCFRRAGAPDQCAGVG